MNEQIACGKCRFFHRRMHEFAQTYVGRCDAPVPKWVDVNREQQLYSDDGAGCKTFQKSEETQAE